MSTSTSFDIINCSHTKAHNHCTLCGVYLHNEVQAYKTERYRTSDETYNLRYLKSLKKQLRKPLTGKYPFPELLYSYLERILEKFEFGMETLALGIYIFNFLYENDRESEKPFEKRMNLYAGVCLMIAAKAIELDRKIPYYSRFQRHADSSYTKQEYQEVENDLLSKLEFDIQIPTFVTFLNYYLINGLLFSTDSLHKKNAFVIEQKVKQLTFKALKSGDYISRNQQKLAGSIVHRARKEIGLGWNKAFGEYSLLAEAECQEENVLSSISLQSVNNLLNVPEFKKQNKVLRELTRTKPQPFLQNKMKFVHSRSVNSSMGIMPLRSRDY